MGRAYSPEGSVVAEPIASTAFAAVAAISGAPSCRSRERSGAAAPAEAAPSKAVGASWADAGVDLEHIPRWSAGTTALGLLLAALFVAVVAPAVITIMLVLTTLEWLRHLVRREPDGNSCCSDEAEGRDEDVLLVLPGTCTYAFWQAGMVQYLCERFDTRGARLVGVSSGAICAGIVLELEAAAAAAAGGGDGAAAAAAVRLRAQEMCRRSIEEVAKVGSWPLGFLGRLGGALDALAAAFLGGDRLEAAGRVRIGVRRLAFDGVPALVPDVVSDFKSGEQFIDAMMASSHVGAIVRPTPMRYLKQKAAWCSDGVNPFSFYCLIEYLQQRAQGLTAITCPPHTYEGLQAIYALWNCGAMRALLPRRGRHLWVTPTVGGRLDIRYSLRVSPRFVAEQWAEGYRHAADLDKQQGFWDVLPRR
eukprot:TRINITY_DN31332_c0_g1_i1.p1 TRINITY_DN31332_c0_g1~~TRINITY_DN31332_c0_g1_i1.p1  ORF type:complete len:442 (+),score=106.12 TRINITY_DN31332_c0_g1_i1:70-1326(+)